MITQPTPTADGDKAVIEALLKVTHEALPYVAGHPVRSVMHEVGARALLEAIRNNEIHGVFYRMPDYAEGVEITSLRTQLAQVTAERDSLLLDDALFRRELDATQADAARWKHEYAEAVRKHAADVWDKDTAKDRIAMLEGLLARICAAWSDEDWEMDPSGLPAISEARAALGGKDNP